MNHDDSTKCLSCHRGPKRGLIFLTSICGHDLCLECRDGNYKHTGSRRCGAAGCSEELRKEDYEEKVYEDGQVHSEFYVRTKLLDCYNNTLETYKELGVEDPLKEYNKYLEDVEDLAYDLTYRRNEPGVKQKCLATRDAYRNKNAKLIASNKERQKQAKIDTEKRQQFHKVEERRRMQTDRARRQTSLGPSFKQQKAELTRDALAGKIPMEEAFEKIGNLKKQQIAIFKGEADNGDAAATDAGPTSAPPSAKRPSPAKREGPKAERWQYKRPRSAKENFGPNVPETPQLPDYAQNAARDIQSYSYNNEDVVATQMVAAGYGPELTVKRAMQDAFSCLFLE